MDSHLELPTIPHSLDRLRSVEMPPFQAAIAAGVDSVMGAHLIFPALDPDYPATLSSPILTGLLRKELGFEGLIVTDALVMGAIANHYGKNDAAVMAVEAGADILLMPLDPEGVIDAVERAVESGRIPAQRIQDSVERIWWAKQRIGTSLDNAGSSHAWETMPPPPIDLSPLSTPATQATATAILRDSMTVEGSIPLPPVPSGINLILVDDIFHADFLGHHTPAIALPQRYGYRSLVIVDQHTPPTPDINLPDTEPILLQVFVRGNPFRGTAGLPDVPLHWLQAFIGSDRLSALIVYGSPYMLDYIKSQHLSAPSSRDIPIIFTFGQMPLAQDLVMKALFP